jgi:AraC family transcriptional activator of pobA
MDNKQQVIRFKTISEFHRFRKLAKPEHPLISIIDIGLMNHMDADGSENLVFDFYSISSKRSFNATVKYGQQEYDYDGGFMNFMSPGQVFSIAPHKNEELKPSGWLMLIHPDFLWNTSMINKIRQCEFFDYSTNEALFLSDKEETIITGILNIIHQEYASSIDKFSQDIIIAQLEVLLTYAERFYQRQFITRKMINHQLLSRLEDYLHEYVNGDEIKENGVPIVTHIAAELNVSARYLGSVLKTLTGLNTQQHIHLKLIEKAKEKLSTTNLSISEIAYDLGFEHMQSFSKLFKTKTKLSPGEFRATYN